MYDELVGRLRASCESCKLWDGEKCCLKGDCSAHTRLEAADAIEELICEVADEHNTRLDAEKRQRWIPVTERLPKHGVHVLAACHVKWLGGGGRYYVCDAFHTEHFKDTCSYSDEIDMEYNEEDDEYYMPEGWWEVIKNWDDYSCVAIGDFVTHWMPLPQPPKEE